MSSRPGGPRPGLRLLVAAALVGAVAAAGGVVWWRIAERWTVRADPADERLVSIGERVYAAECASCHGAGLEGQENWRQRRADGRLPAPPHDGTGHTWHHPDEFLFRVTKHGVEAVAPAGYESDMPGFGDRLSDQEIWAVLAYIKSRWPADIRERQAEMDRRRREAR